MEKVRCKSCGKTHTPEPAGRGWSCEHCGVVDPRPPDRRCDQPSRQREELPCGAWTVTGRGQCHYHGGKTKKGPEHPRFKHGRYSKSVLPSLLGTYEGTLSDPDYLELKEGMALCDVRTLELMERVKEGETPEAWKTLKSEINWLEQHVLTMDADKAKKSMDKIKEIMESRANDSKLWDEIRETQDLRRRLSRTEVMRMKAGEDSINAERMMALLSFVVNILTTHIKDPRVLSDISADIEHYVAQDHGGNGSRAELAAVPIGALTGQ